MCSCRILQFHAFKTYFQRTEKGLIWQVSKTIISSFPYSLICLQKSNLKLFLCVLGDYDLGVVAVLVDQDPALKNAKEGIKIVIGMEGNFISFSFSIYNSIYFSCLTFMQSTYIIF